MPIAVPLNTVAMAVAVTNPSNDTLPAQPQIAAEIDNLQG
jgi:hypothetical protein